MGGWSDLDREGGDPRAEHAPEVLAALRRACAAVRAAGDPALLELARLRLADLLGEEAEADAPAWGALDPERAAGVASWPTSERYDDRERAALALAEQFTVDVTGVPAGPLSDASALLGSGVLAYVQGLYLLDVGQRAAVALAALFERPVPSTQWAWPTEGGPELPEDPMVAVDGLLRATGRLRALDPVLRELVRLRGARHHRCRRCQSVRSVAALVSGATEELLSSDDVLGLDDVDDATRAALRLTDAVLVGRPMVDADLVVEVRAALGPTEAVELVCYLVRNAANKVAVAFGADEAIVEDGYEYQVIADDGDTLTVDAPA